MTGGNSIPLRMLEEIERQQEEQAKARPKCFSFFPHEVPPMMEDCYKNCKHSVVLCKEATHKREASKC